MSFLFLVQFLLNKLRPPRVAAAAAVPVPVPAGAAAAEVAVQAWSPGEATNPVVVALAVAVVVPRQLIIFDPQYSALSQKMHR